MNPWNTKLETNNFTKEEKNIFSSYYKTVRLLDKQKRKSYITSTPIDSKFIDKVKCVYENGYGLKLIARELEIGYTEIRTYFSYFGIPFRTGRNISTEITRTFRSERILGDKNPWHDWTNVYPEMIKMNTKGVQGYFLTNAGNKIWIRSSWEYVYVKWLERNNIKYIYEKTNYILKNGEYYRPDFTILNLDGTIKEIVEIKGYYKNRLYKVDMFREEYPNISITVIDDLTKYSLLNSMTKELDLWKKSRLKE